MKAFTVILCLISISPWTVNGQQKPFNCLILNKIIQRIEIQRQNIAWYNYIEKRCNLPRYYINGKPIHSLTKKHQYKDDIVLDSLLNSQDLEEILSALDDSLFYLSKNNIILDTFGFFSPSCSFQFNHKSIIVVNNRSKIPKDKKYNLLKVLNLNNYAFLPPDAKEWERIGYSTLMLEREGEETLLYKDVILFMYRIKNNAPVVERVMDVSQSDVERR